MRRYGYADSTVGALAVLAVGLTLAASVMPGWVRYLTQVSLGYSLAAVGVMILLKAGLLTFGQSLFYFLGAYSVPLLQRYFGIGDVVLALLAGTFAAVLAAAILGLFTARYRGIFFSMLTLAISMVVYGLAVRSPVFGGSDGLNVRGLTFLGTALSGERLQSFTYYFCVWISCIYLLLAHCLVRSRLGKTAEALEQNEVRLEYLGVSARRTVYLVSLFSAAMGAAGGTMAALSSRHVDPTFAYWTTAGEFVFIVLLGGQKNILAPVAGAVLLEVLRLTASSYFPDQWQLSLGTMMLLIILFLPSGAASLLAPALRVARQAFPAKVGTVQGASGVRHDDTA